MEEGTLCRPQQRTLFTWACDPRPWQVALRNSGLGLHFSVAQSPSQAVTWCKHTLASLPGCKRPGGASGPSWFSGGTISSSSRTAEANCYSSRGLRKSRIRAWCSKSNTTPRSQTPGVQLLLTLQPGPSPYNL